jgi:hypothetical protein
VARRDEMKRYPVDRRVKIDDPSGQFWPVGFRCGGVYGAESVPYILENDAKEGVSVIVGITVARGKPPLMVFRNRTEEHAASPERICDRYPNTSLLLLQQTTGWIARPSRQIRGRGR